MQTVKLGIIGCGAMGVRHAAAAANSPKIELLAIADPIEERARAVAHQHGATRVYTNGEALLEDPEVDAVVLALPTALRTPLALAAFQRGKHLLLEKPAAANATDLRQLITAKNDKVGACCSSRYRFLPSSQRAAEFIKSGALGPLRTLFARDFSPAKERPTKERPAWRLSKRLNGGGILVNWGCYDLDFLLGLTGWSCRPTHILAQTWPISPTLASHIPPESDAETHCTAMVRCANGSVIHYERAEYAALRPGSAWEIVGTNGSLRLQMRPGKGKILHYEYLDPEHGCRSEILWEGDEEGGMLDSAPLHDFVEAILNGTQPATTLEQSLLLQTIVDGIYASAEAGCPLTLE